MNFLIKLLTKGSKPIDGNPEEFLARPWHLGWTQFIVGSVHGLYRAKDRKYQILAVVNTLGGNGHFERTLKWFEDSARRDGYGLSFLEVSNPKLLKRLSDMGFVGDAKEMVKSF